MEAEVKNLSAALQCGTAVHCRCTALNWPVPESFASAFWIKTATQLLVCTLAGHTRGIQLGEGRSCVGWSIVRKQGENCLDDRWGTDPNELMATDGDQSHAG